MTDGITRRTFLRRSTVTACALTAAGPLLEAAAEPAVDPERIGVLVDLTRCIGCRACSRACDERNNLPPSPQPTTVWNSGSESLRFDQWTVVNLVGGDGAEAAVPVKRQCMHCLHPSCVSVCPVGALQQLPSGAVVYRHERCIGCRYCVLACPFDVPKFQWDSGMTPVIGKCQFCAQHATFDGPACAAACPTGTLKFGRRADLVLEAQARMRARPDRYVHHVYGEHEVGGTSWLYLSGRPFAALGFPARLPTVPLPSLTRLAMHLLPAVVVVLAAVLSAISYLRRPRAADATAD